MNCSQAKKLISQYLDRELDDPGRKELEAHCAGCPGCSSELAELSNIFSDLSTPKLITPSPYFLNKVLNRVDAWEETRGFSLRDLRLPNMIALGATIALLLLAGNFAGTALWSGLAQQTAPAAAGTESDAALLAFNDLPQEFSGIYPDATKG